LAACSSPASNVDSGLWHFNAGLYGHAIPKLRQGVGPLEQDNPNDPRLTTAYVALGDMAAQDKEYELAANFYRKAVELARTRHSGVATLRRNSLVHAGNFFRSRGKLAEALPLLAEAAAISGKESAIPRVLHAIDLDNLAVAYASRGDFEEAARHTDKALSILSAEEKTPQTLATRGVVLYNASHNLAQQGRDSEAEAGYKQALTLLTQHGEPRRVKIVTSNYAALLRKLGRAEEAASLEASR
jgi:tetratricopeptide (TPR) repeat protein